MSWQVDVSVWANKPDSIQVFSDDGREVDYVPERTCRNTSHRLDESRFHCSECEFGCWVKDVADGRDKLPSHCPNCGAKVVNDGIEN